MAVETSQKAHRTPNHNPMLIRLLLYTAFAAILTGCSCDWYLNKAKSKCGFTFKSDTIYRKDSVMIDRVTKDTVFKYFQRDTVVVREGRLTMKYFYNSHDSTVYLNGKCDTIKVIKEVPVVVNNTEIKQSLLPFFKWFVILIAVVITGYIAVKWLK